MTNTDQAGPPLEMAAEQHTTEAFTLLGNETRLDILLALWEAYDPRAEDNTVPFSQILVDVDIRDPGNLSYHLEKLDGQFIRQHAEREGYELRESGLLIVQSIIAGAGIQDVTVPTTPIDQRCPFCDAPTAIGYRDGVVIHACTQCDGAAPEQVETDGFLSAVRFDPAGLHDRTAEEIRAASRVAVFRRVQSLFDGLCPTCSGPVDGVLNGCTDHDPAGNCANCGTKFPVWAHFQCRVCKNHSVASPKSLVLFHPAVISFYDDHGVSTRTRADEYESVRRVSTLIDDHEQELVSVDPPKAVVRASREEDTIQLTFDANASVVDVRR